MTEIPTIRNEKGQFLPGVKRWTNGPIGRYCRHCGAFIESHIIDTMYCSKKCRNSYRQPFRRDFEELKRFWDSVGKITENHPLVIKAEEYAAKVILPKHGFTEIFWMRDITRNFFGDILASWNNAKCLVEVTFEITRKIKPDRVPIFQWLGLRVFVCHVKPSIDWYSLKELALGRVNSTTCKAEIRRLMRGENRNGVFLPRQAMQEEGAMQATLLLGQSP